MFVNNIFIFISINVFMHQYDQILSENCVKINGNPQSHHRLSRRHQQQQQEDKIITKRKTRTSSLTSDRHRRERTASCGDRRRRLQSSFSSTDSECDVANSLSNYNTTNKIVVPKNGNLMALSLPTITLQRAFEPEELLTDSYNISKHKQLPEEEILFLPKEQPITSSFHQMKNAQESKNENKFSRNGRQRSSYHNISKYTM